MNNNADVKKYSMYNTYLYDNKTFLHQGIDFLSAPLRIALGGNSITIKTSFEESANSICYRIAMAIFAIAIFPVGIISAISFMAKFLSSEAVIISLFLKSINTLTPTPLPQNQGNDPSSILLVNVSQQGWTKVGTFSSNNTEYFVYEDSERKRYYCQNNLIQLPPYSTDMVKDNLDEENTPAKDWFIAEVVCGERRLKFLVKKEAQVEELVKAAQLKFKSKISGLAYNLQMLESSKKFSDCIQIAESHEKKSELIFFVRLN